MEKQPILVIMAAGMGSRYGGLKQIDPVGAHKELIIDFSIFDAIQAGFKKIVFIIKKVDEEAFREAIGDRIEKYIETEYVYQDLENIPAGYSAPSERTKPWGTGHAILSCKEKVDQPFAVINADDYYGPEAFKKIYNFLLEAEDDDKYRYAMVGYTLSNTLTEHGHVARGVCSCIGDQLESICERTHIAYHEGQSQFLEGETWTPVDKDSIVSMNLWGFTPSIFNTLEEEFIKFLDRELTNNPLKSEFFLPSVVDALIQKDQATVTVLHSKDKWYGVTYKEDKPVVVAAIQGFQAQGIYPLKLWEER
ncbi:sugar phosphate nucleotidyltransferase [Niameybacter massiliensis]|uniref:Sugar phosphate nucleotidyltransferase n=1 Tax=Holtiella tumoricola TaxID=3018743 RepID=A0AA42J031_9FIRM|nr:MULTISPECIES: sugar phosphate nucleotidyltransferase [Lachnospirales]MDA3731042.1 sugar phosphate nucleotidyltransferase [Holtiella tumoricola]